MEIVTDNKTKKRIRLFESLITSYDKKINMISSIRLIYFIIAAIVGVLCYMRRLTGFFILNLVVLATVFLMLVLIHDKLMSKRKELSVLKELNEKILGRHEGDLTLWKDKGEEFADGEHPYSSDLDIFGETSLFQWMNLSKTPKGREALAFALDGKRDFSLEELKLRYEAIEELAKCDILRNKIITRAHINEDKFSDYNELIEWSKREVKDESILGKIVVYLSSALTILSFILSIEFQILPIFVPELMVVLQILILQINKNSRIDEFSKLSKQVYSIESYSSMGAIIERRNFKSQLLKNLRNSFIVNGKGLSESMNNLYKLTYKLKDRKNIFYLVFNVFFLLDYHYYWKANKWRKDYGKHIEGYITSIGDIEDLISFASVLKDVPNFSKVNFKDSKGVEGIDIGHPLIGSRGVKNYINLNPNYPMWLITGSNMSGKSTYLRTIGINLVLAYGGGIACAKAFSCSKSKIYTCMRTGDNLEKSISSFYAEILKIKKVVEAADGGERVFFLLDEIFKGTNSMDRHKGAEILIEQLLKKDTFGLVSTHDFELCDLEKRNIGIKNYNFREYYEDNKIKFDYKLREGRSTTQNALYLMAMAGIKVDGNSKSTN